MAELRITILGCGSSGGVPRIGGHWGDCDPTNPKNARRRCSILVQRVTDEGTTTVLVDTTPDLRSQLIDAGVGRLDGVVYTHAHADHVHGIDDLRMVVINMRERLSVWADAPTSEALMDRFGYVFVQPEGSSYPPILDLQQFSGGFEVSGAGGTIAFDPFDVVHGAMETLGFRIGPVAYSPDLKEMTPAAWSAVQGCDTWIVDALRRDPHPTHIHLAGALEWIAAAKPAKAVLTNMHIDLDYETVRAETPSNVTPAFDGMQLTFEV